MNHDGTLLDPTAEREAAGRARLSRPASLDGLTIGVLDIGKARGDVFLDHLSMRLGERGIEVRRYAKPTPSRTATLEVQQDIAENCDVVIEGLVD